MAPFTSQQQAENQFQLRLLLAFAAMLLGFVTLAARFAWLQVYQHEHFATLAQNNSITLSPIIPNRGLIVDRNGVVLAQNYSAYTLELTPRLKIWSKPSASWPSWWTSTPATSSAFANKQKKAATLNPFR